MKTDMNIKQLADFLGLQDYLIGNRIEADGGEIEIENGVIIIHGSQMFREIVTEGLAPVGTVEELAPPPYKTMKAMEEHCQRVIDERNELRALRDDMMQSIEKLLLKFEGCLKAYASLEMPGDREAINAAKATYEKAFRHRAIKK